MALHPKFPSLPYTLLVPEQRWFAADETMRATAYEKLLPPLVANVRKEVHAWRNKGYSGASATSVALLRHWFEAEHLNENADGSLSTFRYYFAQREAVESVSCDFVFVDQNGFEKHLPRTFAALVTSFTDYHL